MVEPLIKIENILEKSASVLIASHEDPDGDSIGSALALSLALDLLGISNKVFCIHDIPRIYRFLIQRNKFVKSLKNNNFDVLVAVDSSDLGRLRLPEKILEKVKKIINIDHHPDNTMFGDINLVESCSATAQLVYKLIKSLEIKIDKEIASALYMAIITDTGNFTYDNTSPEIFIVAEDLVGAGASPNKIATAVYENRNRSSVNLLREALNKVKFGKDGRVAWVAITNAMLKKNKAKSEDLMGIVDILRSIEGVEVALILRESDEDRKVKINLRSKMLDIQKIAKKLGGGGHYKAAGAVVEGSLNTVKNKVLKEVYKLF